MRSAATASPLPTSSSSTPAPASSTPTATSSSTIIGEGPAQVFTNGQLIEGTWRKADIRSRTEFIGADGAPIPLLSGTTWIEVVEPSGGAFLD